MLLALSPFLTVVFIRVSKKERRVAWKVINVIFIIIFILY